MRTLRKILLVSFLSLAILQNQSKAVDFTWTEGSYNLPLPDYMSINTLNISNDVTVTMNGGGVNQFYMYGDSSLTMYDGSIADLYLYDNTTASFYGGSSSMDWYIDPANTGWVKMYGHLDRFDPYGPYGEGTMHGTWLSNGYSFNIDLAGHGAYSHIQFVPEPATLVMLGLGGLAILKRRKR
jgi:hypothetical protein